MIPLKKKDVNVYKSFRFDCNNAKTWWPWIRNDLDKWVNNGDVIFLGAKEIRTYLKAFYGAPVWTNDEIDTISDVLRKYGIVRKNKKRISNLVEYDDELGGYSDYQVEI